LRTCRMVKNWCLSFSFNCFRILENLEQAKMDQSFTADGVDKVERCCAAQNVLTFSAASASN
jgi:hypothetical protein